MKDDVISRQTAIDALDAQKVKYTFGNDGFSLENAYHDCKLVFDGITDDASFQEADTGLILYYANEIIYALHKALKEVKNQNEELNNSNESSLTQKALDTISRQAAIGAVDKALTRVFVEHRDIAEKVINKIPSAQPDDRLAKIADLVDGTIDHFDLDDAMDLLYQIKEVLK